MQVKKTLVFSAIGSFFIYIFLRRMAEFADKSCFRRRMAEFADRPASGEGWLSLQIELLLAKFADRAAFSKGWLSLQIELLLAKDG